MSYAKMESRAFPFNHFVDSVVQLLNAVKYEDHSYERAGRIKFLQQTYAAAADHFAKQIKQAKLPISLEKVDATLPTTVNLIVCCYPGLSQDVLSALAIYFAYCALLDDDIEEPAAEMASFFGDLIQGKEQTHWWFRQVNEHLTTSVLKHYGSFCAFTILRSTLDCGFISLASLTPAVVLIRDHSLPRQLDRAAWPTRLSWMRCLPSLSSPPERFRPFWGSQHVPERTL